MATTIKTTEPEKIVAEENKSVNSDLDKVKLEATVDTKSSEAVSNKEDDRQITDKATLENTKNESIDSEETGFEIITPEPVKNRMMLKQKQNQTLLRLLLLKQSLLRKSLKRQDQSDYG
eukprot:TRINITY_DN20838_c0_g1_i1.p2 TRINITY_DN20838_c0_g1~~TRINITY_DN20838_c0_g1_i1.p2  ORF type:complete len:119 (-),score=31.47 TRINITY_DN20838_c0_g1_i1:571-927(-)